MADNNKPKPEEFKKGSEPPVRLEKPPVEAPKEKPAVQPATPKKDK